MFVVLVSAQTRKKLGSHCFHPYKNKIEKLKIKDFSQTHQRTKFTGRIVTPNSKETRTSRETQLRTVYLEKMMEP